MEIIIAHAVNNLCYKAGRKMTPQGIVVHSTGVNNPNLKRYVDAPVEVGVNAYGNHWNNPAPGGEKVCVHAFIGYDKDKNVRVAEILPLDICAWGVGNGRLGSYNYDPAYIQFEICEDSLSDEVYYKKAFDAAAEYCALLCREYSISIENIVGHNEAYKRGYASNHGDPEHWMKKFGENMDDLRAKVKNIVESESEKTPYGVIVGEFDSEESAQETLKKAKEKGFVDAFIAFILRNSDTGEKEPERPEIKAGSTVKVKKGAKTYDGIGLASFVYPREHKVLQIAGDRVVITYNGTVVAAMKVGDLELV